MVTINDAAGFAMAAIKAGTVARGDYGKLVEAYTTLAELGEEAGAPFATRLADTLMRNYRNIILNHDERGLWIGSAGREYGWTP